MILFPQFCCVPQVIQDKPETFASQKHSRGPMGRQPLLSFPTLAPRQGLRVVVVV
jgi:hypothetical protein